MTSYITSFFSGGSTGGHRRTASSSSSTTNDSSHHHPHQQSSSHHHQQQQQQLYDPRIQLESQSCHDEEMRHLMPYLRPILSTSAAAKVHQQHQMQHRNASFGYHHHDNIAASDNNSDDASHDDDPLSDKRITLAPSLRLYTSLYDPKTFHNISLPPNALFINFTSHSFSQAMNMCDMQQQEASDCNFLDLKLILVVCEVMRNHLIKGRMAINGEDAIVVLYYPERIDFIALLVSCFMSYNQECFSPIEIFSDLIEELCAVCPPVGAFYDQLPAFGHHHYTAATSFGDHSSLLHPNAAVAASRSPAPLRGNSSSHHSSSSSVNRIIKPNHPPPSPYYASLKRYCGYFHALLHSSIPDPYSTKLDYITMSICHEKDIFGALEREDTIHEMDGDGLVLEPNVVIRRHSSSSSLDSVVTDHRRTPSGSIITGVNELSQQASKDSNAGGANNGMETNGMAPLFVIRAKDAIHGTEREHFCVAPKPTRWFTKKTMPDGSVQLERAGNKYEISCPSLIGDYIIDVYFLVNRNGRSQYKYAFRYAMNNTMAFGVDLVSLKKNDLDCAFHFPDQFIMNIHFEKSILNKDTETFQTQRTFSQAEVAYVRSLEELMYTSPASYLRDPRMRHEMRLQSLPEKPSKKVESLKHAVNAEFRIYYPKFRRQIDARFEKEAQERKKQEQERLARQKTVMTPGGTTKKSLQDIVAFKMQLQEERLNAEESSEEEEDEQEPEEFITEDREGTPTPTWEAQPSAMLGEAPATPPSPPSSPTKTPTTTEAPSTSGAPPPPPLPPHLSESVDTAPSSLGGGPPPPPPPPPPMFDASSGGIPPPPPPPMGAQLGGGPPPPPPMGGSTPAPAVRTKKNGLKKFHWQVISRNRAMVSMWKSLDALSPPAVVDKDELKKLFKNKTTKKVKAKKEEEKPTSVSLVGGERSRNIEIIAGQFKQFYDLTVSVPEILEKLQEDKLDEAQLNSLSQCVLTKREKRLFEDYRGDWNLLTKGDAIAYKISCVPRIDNKIQTMIYLKTFSSKVEDLHGYLKTKLEAYEALRQSQMFSRILKILLSIGNALNEGHRKLGNAPGFALSSLPKTHIMKSSDGKISLMTYLCQLLEKEGYSGPEQLEQELAPVLKALDIPTSLIDSLQGDIGQITDFFRLENKTCEEEKEVYQEKVRLFAEHTAAQQDALSKMVQRYENDYQLLVAHFGEPYKKEDEFLQPVAEFVEMLKLEWNSWKQKEARLKRQESKKKFFEKMEKKTPDGKKDSSEDEGDNPGDSAEDE